MTIACRICQAVYTPSQDHSYLLRAPAAALESAFMSMCHFCFRCRRPACPQCWDNVHGICGECCLEAKLPFRTQMAPLRGVLFATTRQAQLRRKHATPVRLLCIRPGRFQVIASIDTAETNPQQSVITQTIHNTARQAPINTIPESSIEEKAAHPSRLQNTRSIDEITTRPATAPATVRPNSSPQPAQSRPTRVLNIDEIATRQPRMTGPTPPSSPILAQPGLTRVLNIDEIGTQPPPSSRNISGRETDAHPRRLSHKKNTSRRASSPLARLEQILTVVLLIVLISILLLIILALISAQINSVLQQSVHINIRAELAYLWHLIGQIHF
ncbi:hypothetical protein [Dictyobacter arantiisoli]|uniref:Uncharacterized protein n=1 Tax=Dictyobacter arantiisoli TaxID=2014874 RepID=A0A5A5TKC5_9CHLR|nr:hypothetical protein [Dictyobacter arantiisoli]GCF11344.1 hypothetical protein KDI_49080 [Dictyobacter arantiisoli]